MKIRKFSIFLFILITAVHGASAHARNGDVQAIASHNDHSVNASGAVEKNDTVVSPSLGPRAFGNYPTVQQMEVLGRRIFADPGLSASGKMSCSSCHSPAQAFGPPNALATQFGGINMKQPGTRAVPTLKYLQTTIPFTEHYIDDEDGHGDDAGPTGGLTWDGHVNSLHEQAAIPLLAAHEMANHNIAEIARRLHNAGYASEFRAAFSAPQKNVFDDDQQVFGWLTMALEVYQQNASEFYPFTSKYDAFLRQQTQLSEKELRGLALFNDTEKGNCASCHPSGNRSGGGFPLLTDSGYIALGVPRNRHITANRDPGYYDMGLCGPGRTDLDSHAEYCGRFKAPSLRNVALRKSFFHNGVFHSLREVIDFYVTRDIHPERWYPRERDGRIHKFNDLPGIYHNNINVQAPFEPLPGGKPRLNPTEIIDVIAFLNTLTDGYQASGEVNRRSTLKNK